MRSFATFFVARQLLLTGSAGHLPGAAPGPRPTTTSHAAWPRTVPAGNRPPTPLGSGYWLAGSPEDLHVLLSCSSLSPPYFLRRSAGPTVPPVRSQTGAMREDGPSLPVPLGPSGCL